MSIDPAEYERLKAQERARLEVQAAAKAAETERTARHALIGCGGFLAIVILVTAVGMEFGGRQAASPTPPKRPVVSAAPARAQYERVLRETDPSRALFLAVRRGADEDEVTVVVGNAWHYQALPGASSGRPESLERLGRDPPSREARPRTAADR